MVVIIWSFRGTIMVVDRELTTIGADTMGHRGARAPHFWFVVGTGGAQITVMKRKWSSLEDDRQFTHSIWKYEQHLYNVIFVNSSFHFDGCAPNSIKNWVGTTEKWGAPK